MIIGIEGLDAGEVAGLIERNRDFIDRFITVGVDSDCKADDLDSGMRAVMDLTKTGDTIISYVKCFR